jgi:DNA-binding NarL/FixJ family response regulator
VDDHPAIIASIGVAIEAADDLELGGTAATLDDAVAMLASGRPMDVVLCDMQLSGGAEGLQLLATRASVPSQPAVIILSGFDQRSLIRTAFERGAAGYLIKTAPIDEILAAVRTVAAGGTAFSAAAVGAVRSAPRRPSDRELQVLGLVGAGASNAEAAATLGVSEKTIESHLRRLFDRYGVLSRTELTVFAINEGWVVADRMTS